MARAGVSALAADHPDRGQRLYELTNLLFSLFRRTDSIAAITEAIQTGREGIACSRPDDPVRLAHLIHLGICAYARYLNNGELALIAEAIAVTEEALAATWPGHKDRALLLNNFRTVLHIMAERTADSAMLAQAVRAGRDAIAETPAGDPDLPTYQIFLLPALLRLADRSGEPALVAEAVRIGRSAFAQTAPEDQDRADRFDRLEAALDEYLFWSEDRTALLAALRLARRTARTPPPSDDDLATFLNLLSWKLQSAATRLDDVDAATLTEAMQLAWDAAAATPAGDQEDLAYSLSLLSQSLRRLAEWTEDDAPAVEAAQVARQALAALPADHDDRAEYLNDLSIALVSLYLRAGDAAALEEAVRASRDAVAATSPDEPSRNSYLSWLGNTLRVLFRRTGDAGLLAEAITITREAVEATPPDDPGAGPRLVNLAVALSEAFTQTGDTDALTEAVQAARDAVTATPAGEVDRARYLSNLAEMLRLLADRTDDDLILAEAVRISREAVAATATGHWELPSRLGNLSLALKTYSERTGDQAALAEGTKAARDAVAAVGAGAERAQLLSNLGCFLREQYEHDRDPALLAQAVRIGRDAVDATAADEAGQAACLVNLGLALDAHFEYARDDASLAQAWDCYTRAGAITAAPVTPRLTGFRYAAQIAEAAGRTPQEALRALEGAVGLLPRFASRALARADQEHAVGKLGDLASDVAAIAVAARAPGRAVELLEQARGILVADTLSARSSDLSRLRARLPALADEFERVRNWMDALDREGALAAGPAGPRRVTDTGTRQAAHAAWDDIVRRIRAMPDFESFLMAPDLGELAAQACSGAIILPFSSASGSGALILDGERPDLVRAMSLDFTEADAFGQVERMLNAIDQTARGENADAARAELNSVLAWIWDSITEPILTSLGHVGTPADGPSWPRVWWCPVGVLGYLPLHAGGYHQDKAAGLASPRTVLDRVVSSYTPTIRALAYSRSQPDPAENTTLIVAVPDAPGQSPLPGARREAQQLAAVVPRSRLLASPTRQSVLAALPGNLVAHFACHGIADMANPQASHIVLHHTQDGRLTVADIGGMRLTAGLAYLSACETSVTPLALADEAVHITAAFQLAGYQHVIGTLWSVNDISAMQIATRFYDRLTRGGLTTPNVRLSSRALHAAVRWQRDRFPQYPELWAAYIHAGS